MATRTINFQLVEQTPQIRRLWFYPHRVSAVDGVLLQEFYSVESDASGAGSIELPVPASGSIRYDYELPSAKNVSRGYFYLEAGAAIDLDDLITAGGPVTVPLLTAIQTAVNTHAGIKASTTVLGHVKVDGTTITADGSGVISSHLADGDKGDITVSGSGAVWSIDGKPASGFVGIAEVQTLTNKTISGASNTLFNIDQSSIRSLVGDLAAKQATLVSGTNIKTVNGSSLLGSGNLAVGGVSIGGAVGGGTPKSVLFVDGAGNVAQSSLLQWDNDKQFLVKTTGEVSYTGAILLEFDGGTGGGGYTAGLRIKSTNAAGYLPSHIVFENTAYGTAGYIANRSTNGVSFGSGAAGTEIMRLATGAGYSAQVYPNTGDVGVLITLKAGASANTFEIRNSGGTLIGGRNVAGETIQTLRTPANSSATGYIGTVVWDTGYIYVCTATNTWKRVAISTW